MTHTFRYTARILAPDLEDMVAEDATMTVEAKSMAEAMAVFSQATALDSADDMNFQIIRIQTI